MHVLHYIQQLVVLMKTPGWARLSSSLRAPPRVLNLDLVMEASFASWLAPSNFGLVLLVRKVKMTFVFCSGLRVLRPSLESTDWQLRSRQMSVSRDARAQVERKRPARRPRSRA
jgi:hypothetical protein